MEEPKNIVVDSEERREARKRRRQRNQILAYTLMILLIASVAFGAVTLIKRLPKENVPVVDQVGEEETTNPTQSVVEEMLSEEEEIVETEPVIELTPEQRLDEIVNAAIEVMPLEDKVAGLFIATPESITGASVATKAGDGTKTALEKYAVGGVIYRTQNIQDADQISLMLDNTRLYSKYPLFLGITQELGASGPLVQTSLIDATTTAKELAATGDATQAFMAGQSMGLALSQYGFNLNFAPLADLSAGKSYLDSTNYFGDNVILNSAFSTAFAGGMKTAGVTGCLKLFPGSGMANKVADSEMLNTEQSVEDFMAKDMEMYRNAIESGVDMIMVGNYSASALTGDRTPCALSPIIVTDYLRTELGYQGVVITDLMNQKAITEYYEADVAAITALKAGCDMILAPEDFDKAYTGVLEAVQNGTIAEGRIDDALRRVYRIKFADRVITE